ncbi:MAG: glycerol kinase GlpK [Acidimicrobiia bacterium]
MAYVGAIDQGTTSTRFVIVDDSGRFVSMSQMEHTQFLPQPGWVEHDAEEIWRNTESVVRGALDEAGLTAEDLAAVGITNQRETTVIWDRETGMPVAPAIVWQDTRTARIARDLNAASGEKIRQITGLPPATYFAGPKVRWMLENDDAIRDLADVGRIAFGTIDSWLAFKLTGLHITDVTNASRTMLMDLATLKWDAGLCDLVGIPMSMLPEIVPSIGTMGECTGVLQGAPLACMLGDQHAALFGQAGFDVGATKVTYGTGAFLVANTGHEIVRSDEGLLTTVAFQISGQAATYALEGSVAVAGSGVQWLRDQLGLISEAPEVEELAATVDDNGDVFFVPAFSGLFAPYWRDDARAVLVGMTRFSNKGHIARAVLESTAFQVRDVLAAMERDTGVTLDEIRVDGGMVENDMLMQFQADILDIDVVVPQVTETTVLGAAYGAGIAAGVWKDEHAVAQQWREASRVQPTMGDADRSVLVRGWEKAIDRSLGWVEE